jgi:hypothetical protein
VAASARLVWIDGWSMVAAYDDVLVWDIVVVALVEEVHRSIHAAVCQAVVIHNDYARTADVKISACMDPLESSGGRTNRAPGQRGAAYLCKQGAATHLGRRPERVAYYCHPLKDPAQRSEGCWTGVWQCQPPTHGRYATRNVQRWRYRRTLHSRSTFWRLNSRLGDVEATVCDGL